MENPEELWQPAVPKCGRRITFCKCSNVSVKMCKGEIQGRLIGSYDKDGEAVFDEEVHGPADDHLWVISRECQKLQRNRKYCKGCQQRYEEKVIGITESIATSKADKAAAAELFKAGQYQEAFDKYIEVCDVFATR